MTQTIDYGIDLGTTNSSICCCRGGEVRIFQSVDLMNVTPSVVHVGRSGRMLVGRRAYDAWVQDPANVQAEFKRWMGFSDTLPFPASGRTMSAEQLSAEVLKSLRADATRAAQEDVNAAVITVPAAFGSLQCDATGKAAQLAGFQQAPLLQEPIAAAIAYGAGPTGRNQRWMVFDLGGGTLDIAVVSTRNGRLAVLEHQGDNRLGGKDIDRAIAETFFLEPLAAQFKLPDRVKDPAAYERLLRLLVRHAEQAKIALSSADEATAELFDLGDDLVGKPIEAAITVRRADVEHTIEPLLDRCLKLVDRALEGARVAKADLDKVLLVGGPTQMPVVRAALASATGAKLDTSIDPMTVVARGAALYASMLEKTVATLATQHIAAVKPASRGVAVQLQHERASGTPRSPVAGVLPANNGVAEVKVDAAGGFWTSGWTPVVSNCFQLDVLLNEKQPATTYVLTARDASGRAVPVEPSSFSVSYMLPMAAPPLPHTIAVELSTENGRDAFDPIFKRGSPLPAEARRTYRADRTLRPSEFESSLPIKFWEIEVSEDPEEKWWAGCVHVKSEKLKRPLMQGSEIELTIKIDPSRKMTVEVFVPSLNQSFEDGVYVPDPPTARSQLSQQLELCFERLERVHRLIYENDREEFKERAEMLQMRVESIYEQVNEEQKRGTPDPDALLGPADQLRKIRVQLAHLVEQLETGNARSPLAREVLAEARWTEMVIWRDGSDSQKAEFQRLQPQLERYVEKEDARGLRFVQQQHRDLRWLVLRDQRWFWDHLLNYLRRPGQRFLNRQQADAHLRKAEQAQRQQDLPAMRRAISDAFELQPPDQIEAAKDQAMQSGLRGG